METGIAPSLAFARKLGLRAKTGQARGLRVGGAVEFASTATYETIARGFAVSDPLARGESSIADGSAATHHDGQMMVHNDADEESAGVFSWCLRLGHSLTQALSD
jgi:hypothetical protein